MTLLGCVTVTQRLIATCCGLDLLAGGVAQEGTCCDDFSIIPLFVGWRPMRGKSCWSLCQKDVGPEPYYLMEPIFNRFWRLFCHNGFY